MTVRVRFQFKKPLHLLFVLIFAVCLVWSAYKPLRWDVWFIEVLPVLSGLIVVVAAYKRYRLTTVAYGLLCASAVITLIGGHYT